MQSLACFKATSTIRLLISTRLDACRVNLKPRLDLSTIHPTIVLRFISLTRSSHFLDTLCRCTHLSNPECGIQWSCQSNRGLRREDKWPSSSWRAQLPARSS